MTSSLGEQLATVLVLLGAAVPAGRALTSRPIVRELRTHSVLGAVAILVALVGIGFVGWLMVRSVVWSRTVVAVVLAVWLLLWLHARVAFGRGRGLPPGSLGITTSLLAIDDPMFYASAAAVHGPVFKMQQIHRPVVCITDAALMQDLVSREEEHLGQSEWSFNRLVPQGYLEYMEGAAHQKYRAVFARAFTPEVGSAAREAIATVSRTQLSAMALMSANAGIHPEPFLYEVPFISLLHTVLGVDRDHADLTALRAGFEAITVPFEIHLPTPPAIARGYADLVDVVGRLAQVSVSSPFPSVLREVVRADATAATDPTILGNLVLMVKEGSIMVRGLLRWVLHVLASEPEQSQHFRDVEGDPGKLDAASHAFVLETLRLHESRYLYRTARADLTVGRFRIPRGWLVRFCLGEAHENPQSFPEPGRFDPHRFRDSVPGPDRYCPFGVGAHSCLGEDITLAIAGTFAREAALGWQLRKVSDGPPWRINRHWGLWRPSTEYRIKLSERTDTRNGD